MLIGLTAIVAFSVVGFAHWKDCGPLIYEGIPIALPTANYISWSSTYIDNGEGNRNWEWYDGSDKNPGPCQFTCLNGYQPSVEYSKDGTRGQFYCNSTSDTGWKRFALRKSTLSADDKKYVSESDKKLKNNTLTATIWDDLMNELDNLRTQLFAIEYTLGDHSFDIRNLKNTSTYTSNIPSNIPKWAIMAFNLSECPDWWTGFDQADGKFLMWWAWKAIDKVYYKLWDTGWSNSIKLKADQLPEHHHYMFWPKNSQDSDNETYRKSHYIESQDKRFIAGDTDRINMSQYRMKTIREERSSTTYTRSDESKVRAWLTSSKLVDTGWNYISQKSIDIKNPYIAILYCIKE